MNSNIQEMGFNDLPTDGRSETQKILKLDEN